MARKNVRLNIEQRTSIAGGASSGETAGETGRYERLAGNLDCALDPRDPRLPYVVDRGLAPR